MPYFVAKYGHGASSTTEYLAVVTYWYSETPNRTAEWVTDTFKAYQFDSMAELTRTLEELELEGEYLSGQICHIKYMKPS